MEWSAVDYLVWYEWQESSNSLAIGTKINIPLREAIVQKIKASEMLVAPRISEYFFEIFEILEILEFVDSKVLA